MVLEIPSKPRHGTSPNAPKVVRGSRRIVIDATTGLVLLSQTFEDMEGPRQSYRVEITITSKRMGWNTAVDEASFHVPSGLTEVKEFSRWNAERMKKD